MGVILKYQVSFPEVGGLRVSNDLASADFIIDADIKAEMARGIAGSQFEVKLYDLPEKKTREIDERLQSAKFGTVVIKLGYMDGAREVVMAGIYRKVVVTVEGDKRLPSIG